MDKISLGLEKWAEYARNGIDIPITTLLHGNSMEPLIRYMKDEVTITPMKREPLVGDVVLFRRADGKYVVHRVHQVTEAGVRTWGDNCVSPDAPLRREDVLGLVVRVKRGGREIALDTPEQRAYGERWTRRGRAVWLRYKRLRALGGKAIRKVYPDFHKNRRG